MKKDKKYFIYVNNHFVREFSNLGNACYYVRKWLETNPRTRFDDIRISETDLNRPLGGVQ